MFDYRQHIIQQHRIDLEFFEYDCPDPKTLDQFKAAYRSKYHLTLVEEDHDGSTCLVFKCDKDKELNGTCTAKLNVFENGDGYLISGVVTHINHEVPLHSLEQVFSKTLSNNNSIVKSEPIQKPSSSMSLNSFNRIKQEMKPIKIEGKALKFSNFNQFLV